MSQYGHPPQGGQHPDQGWGQQAHPYGGQGYGQPQGYPQPGGGYATWGQRALATLWEVVVVLPGLALLFVGTLVLGVGGAMSSGDGGGLGTALVVIGVLLVIAGYGWALWRQFSNIWFDQGRTGYTYGKRKVAIRVIREQDGQPMGIGVAVARWLLHGILNSCLMLDYLWPLWDAKNQTLTDKVLGTIVVNQPDQQQPHQQGMVQRS